MRTVSEILKDHVRLDIESFDRLYLNAWIPKLQTSGQLCYFLTQHRGHKIPSPVLLNDMTKNFVKNVEQFIEDKNIPLIPFRKGQRKDDIANQERKKNPARDCVVFVGVAQEKQKAFKGKKTTDKGYLTFDYSRQEAFVKHYYFYIDDEDFGPCFIKIGTYAPFPIRICLNGHEWAKRQLEKAGLAFESLDNGFLSCEDPKRLQEICEDLGAEQIESFFRKWVKRLPFPVTHEDIAAGYQHDVSVWQAEVSKTQIFDRPIRGREFFENVMRENMDLGRPDRAQLVFDRKVIKTTPGFFRTRVIHHGVNPSLHIQYKSADLKQYFKENRGLRTECTINNPEDFRVGKRLKNLSYLKEIGRNVNRRLLEVQRVSQDCLLSASSMERLTQPSKTEAGHKAPGFKIGDPRVMALLAALTLFVHLPNGFKNKDLRQHVADLMGVERKDYSAGQMSYDLRRLRLKGLIARRTNKNRYFLTPYGYRVTQFITRLNARLFRPGFACLQAQEPIPHPLSRALAAVNQEVDRMLERAHLIKHAA